MPGRRRRGHGGHGRIDEPFKVSQAGDIGPHHNCITPGVPQPLLGGGQPLRVPPADRDAGPFFNEPVRKRRSQPVGPAGDQHDLAREVQIHRAILAQPREQPHSAFRLRATAAGPRARPLAAGDGSSSKAGGPPYFFAPQTLT